MKRIRCEYCEGEVLEGNERVPFEYRGDIIYVENVPVQKCSKCGEIYFPIEVYKKLERIAQHRKQILATVSFPLADYRSAGQIGT